MSDRTPEEQWLPVIGYEGSYSVSNCGRVRSEDRVITLRNGRTQIRWGRTLATFRNTTGRLVVRLNTDRSRQFRTVHKLVAEAFLGPKPASHEVCHGDGDCLNNHLSNLRWDTHSGNMRDSVRHGTHGKARQATCSRGHRLAPPNLTPSQAKRGRRDCLACNRARAYARIRWQRFGEVINVDAEADRRYAQFSEQGR